MSGSYDRPTRRPLTAGGPLPPQTGRDDRAPLTGPPTMPPTHSPMLADGRRLGEAGARLGPDGRTPEARASDGRSAERPQPGDLDPPRREIHVPAPVTGPPADSIHGPIVPAGSVTGRSLTLVITIMCFLASLTAGAVYMMHQSAEAWLKDIASEVTVQIEPRAEGDVETVVKEVAAFLTPQPGVKAARPLSAADSASLLEPWLGQSDILKQLPVPRLIALEMDRDGPPDLTALRASLVAKFKGVSLDDHRQWQKQIRTVTRSFALGGFAILLLVAAATTAVIVSATRSAMASNREIVEVLHFVGATDRFIAREFEKHFLRLGIRAGLVGALSAMAVFLIMPFTMELLGGGSVTMAEIRNLIGAGSLEASGYVLLSLVVVIIAALCMLTSRFGVFRILNTKG